MNLAVLAHSYYNRGKVTISLEYGFGTFSIALMYICIRRKFWNGEDAKK